MTRTATSLVSFSGKGDELRVRDELENLDLVLTLDGPVTPEPALTDLFHFPVDRAVSCVTSSLELDEGGAVFLRDENGQRISDFSEDDPSFPRGTYYLDISTPIRTYVRINDSAISVSLDESGDVPPIRLSVDPGTRITVGARSLHRQPEATITVPDDPEAVMEAVSYLGSSIKEFSPERSWPTLRGHPPAIERGAELNVPDSLSKPDTGVVVTVPPTYAAIYRVVPLAFYFGATVQPGDPALHLPNGYTESLETETRSLEESVDWLLARCLVLDSLVRDAGYNPIPLHQYEEISPHLPFYPQALYEESLTTQVMEYLEVSEDELRGSLPQWQTTAVLRPVADDVELLPYLLDKLARIHVATDPADYERAGRTSPSPTNVTGFTHGEVPVGCARLTTAGFEHALNREVPTVESFHPVVVARSDSEAAALRRVCDGEHGYHTPDRLDVHPAPTREELRRLLTGGADFVLCGLPTVADGFECVDGVLAPGDIDDVDAGTVVLGGERAESHAETLVERGAVTALVTDDPLEPQAMRRILSATPTGNGLATVASFALGQTPYRLVGDATHEIVRHEGGMAPCRVEVDMVSPDEHTVTMQPLPTDLYPLGGTNIVHDSYAVDDFTLIGVRTRRPETVDAETVVDILDEKVLLVSLNGEPWYGETEPTVELVRQLARRSLGLEEDEPPESGVQRE